MLRTWAASAALLVTAAAPSAAPAQAIHAQQTMAGQRLVAPSGPMEVSTARLKLKATDPIPMHMHFWPRYVFVESGEVQVTVLDSGVPQTFTAGQLIVEPIQKWHWGKAITDSVLIAVEQTPPGGCNTVRPPVLAPPAPPTTNDECPRP